MRLKIIFKKGNRDVNIQNQHNINGYVHKCLGKDNKYHDNKPSHYSISGLRGGKLNSDKKTLSFKNNPYIIISSLDYEFINNIVEGVCDEKNKSLFSGMEYDKIEIIDEKNYDGWNYFATLSPILIRIKNEVKKYNFVTVDDDDFEDVLTENTKRKLLNYDTKLDLKDFKIKIPENKSHKVKFINGKGKSFSRASQCHVNVFSTKKIAKILYHIGLGKSTGSGFGSIYYTNNHDLYQ